MTTDIASTGGALTVDEMKADLSLEQLRQLVGLVEYDADADPFPVTGWDAICFVVGNATQAAHYYASALGHGARSPTPARRTATATTSPTCSSPAPSSSCVSGAVAPDSPLIAHHARHGDGVVDIALEVPDVDQCIAQARKAGATVLAEPRDVSRRARHGADRRDRDLRRDPPHAGAAHRRRRDLRRSLPPRLRQAVEPRWQKRDGQPKRLFQALDHIVGNVELGRMDEWVTFYNKVMGFVNMAEFIGDDIATDYSALMSKVVANGNHRVKFPLNEPAIAKKKSQIDEYLEFYNGPGAQHLAVATGDILASVDALRANGVEFLDTPDSYYEDPELRARIGEVRVPIEELQKRGILVDRDEDGYLLQIFTKPLGDRPDGVLRAHRAPRLARLRQGQLQGALRGHRARAGRPRQPVTQVTPAERRARHLFQAGNGLDSPLGARPDVERCVRHLSSPGTCLDHRSASALG